MLDRKEEMVADRIGASKTAAEDAAYHAGRKAGISWAEDTAEWAEVKTLASIEDDFWRPSEPGAFGISGALRLAMLEEDEAENVSRSELEAFWNEIAGEAYPDENYVRGFYDGVVEVHDKVVNDLD